MITQVFTVPPHRLGTPYQSPAWRYMASRNPGKFGFRGLLSRKADNAGFLKRLLLKGVDFKVDNYMPEKCRKWISGLPADQCNQFYSSFEKYKRKSGKRQLSFCGVKHYSNLLSWHARSLEQINDVWLKKLIRHIYGLEHNSHINTAITFHVDEAYQKMKQFIGYQIFAGFSDNEIATQWKLSPKLIEAIRNIFFDFGCLPTNKVAQWGLLVQWKNNDDIKDDEFLMYKRVYEMGAVGLKAQVSGYSLTDDERQQVSKYLTNSAMVNTFNLNFATRTTKDCLVYNKVIADLTRLGLQREEVNIKRSELKILELQTQKMQKEMDDIDPKQVQSEDLQLIDVAVRLFTAKDCEPKFKQVTELHQANEIATNN